jgi:hypothetical protein
MAQLMDEIPVKVMVMFQFANVCLSEHMLYPIHHLIIYILIIATEE